MDLRTQLVQPLLFQRQDKTTFLKPSWSFAGKDRMKTLDLLFLSSAFPTFPLSASTLIPILQLDAGATALKKRLEPESRSPAKYSHLFPLDRTASLLGIDPGISTENNFKMHF